MEVKAAVVVVVVVVVVAVVAVVVVVVVAVAVAVAVVVGLPGRTTNHYCYNVVSEGGNSNSGNNMNDCEDDVKWQLQRQKQQQQCQ